MNGDAPVVDKEVLVMLQDAIGDSLANIIDLYLTDVPQSISQMRTALNTQDLETVRRLAHSLKASSANLGAMQTSKYAADLEQQINDGETDQMKIKGSIEAIINSFDQARTILQGIQLN